MSDDFPAITAGYEAHMDMCSMLSVFAEMRGDGVVDSRDRQSTIELAAYFRAEERGFVPGGEQEDWLAAERMLRRSSTG